MTTSPMQSARSARASARPASSSSARGKAQEGYATVPPMKLLDEEAVDSNLASARNQRPNSSGGASMTSVKSHASTLSTKLKTSPYAVPMSARGAEAKPLISARYSARGLVKSRPNSSGELELPAATNTPRIAQPVTPPIEPITPPSNGPVVADVEERQPEVTLDQMLEQEGLGTVEEEVKPESPNLMNESSIVDEQVNGDHVVDQDAAPVVDDGNDCTVVAIHVDESKAIPDDQPEEVEVTADLLPMSPESVPDCVINVDLPEEVPFTPPSPVAEERVQSAQSSVYCNDSTIIGSIPDCVAIPPSDLSPIHMSEEEVADRVCAPSPGEPTTTPIETVIVGDSEDIRESLNKALSDFESPAASPIAAPLNLSVFSPGCDVAEIRDVLVADAKPTGSVIKDRKEEASRKRGCWSRIFACGKKQ